MGVLDEWSYTCNAVDRTRLTGQLTLKIHAYRSVLFSACVCRNGRKNHIKPANSPRAMLKVKALLTGDPL